MHVVGAYSPTDSNAAYLKSVEDAARGDGSIELHVNCSAVELARLRERPVAQIAKDLGISESCLRAWMDQDDVDAGRREGLAGDERAELVRLRRENRVQAMEIEMLKRASAYFARENVLPE